MGKYARLISTGEVVSVVVYDDRAIWVTTLKGQPMELLLDQVQRMTSDEESAFLKSRNSN